MDDLITELQNTAEGSHELSRKFGLAIGELHLDDKGELYRIDRDDGGHSYGGNGDETIITPRWTTSLDAIMRLIEREYPTRESDIMHSAVSAVNKKHALHIRVWRQETDGSYAQALALALCVEFLRENG